MSRVEYIFTNCCSTALNKPLMFYLEENEKLNERLMEFSSMLLLNIYTSRFV